MRQVLFISFKALKLFPQTALSKSPLTELQFFFSCLFSCFFFFSCVSDGPLNPFLGCCMHQQTCWYDLKGHVLFTLTEAFQNSDEGVPLKRSAVTLQQHEQQPGLKPNWLMFYIKSLFFFPPLFYLHFRGLVMLNRDGLSALTLPASRSYSLRRKRINWLSLMSSTWVHFLAASPSNHVKWNIKAK